MDNYNVDNMLQQAASEATEIAKGKLNAKTHNIMITDGVDVIAIREKLNMSRNTFSETFGLKSRTVEKWEQAKNKIDATAKAYLTVIANDPESVRRALHS